MPALLLYSSYNIQGDNEFETIYISLDGPMHVSFILIWICQAFTCYITVKYQVSWPENNKKYAIAT